MRFAAAARLIAGVLLALASAWPDPAASAQPRRGLEDGATGDFTFHSIGQSRAIILPATLSLPPPTKGPSGSWIDFRVGAVVLLSDLPGPTAAATAGYAQRFTAAGLAVLTVDSFAGRGLREAGEAAGLASLRQVEDAYAALSILRSHPAIDANRIALIGLGRGGLAAIEATLSAMRDIARGDAPVDGASYAAVAALYPTCAMQWHPVESIGRPLLIQAGALDDLAGTGHCEDYARRLRGGNSAGVAFRVYPGLPAAWEVPAFERPEAERLDRCLAILDLDGSLTERATGLRHLRGQISSFLDACRLKGRRGGGGDPESAARAFEDLLAFLASVGVSR